MPDVAVIGCGPAGMAAAWALAEGGARVTVYERGTRCGGRLTTDSWGGMRVDAGVQLLASYYRATFALARAVGAADRLVASPGRDALWRNGRAHEITYGAVAGMLASTALPARLKLRLGARYLPFLQRHAERLDAADPRVAAGDALDSESIADWGRRELGEEFVEWLVYPLLASYYNLLPEETSAAFYHALARAGLGVRVYGVEGGMGALAGAAESALRARGVAFRFETEVTDVAARSDGGVGVAWRDGDRVHDAAAIAVSAPAAAGFAGLDAPTRTWLAAVEVRPTVSLALMLDGPVPARYFGLSFPRTEAPGARVAAVCVQERKVAGLVPEGRGLLVVLPAPALAPSLVGRAPDAVLEALLPAVEQALPGIGARVERARLYRFPDGGVLVRPGSLARLRSPPEAASGDIALAGDYMIAPTVEGAVRSGRIAASRLLSRAAGGRGARGRLDA